MKAISNTPVDITEYCGNLIITYLSDDKKAVQPLLDYLQHNGYEYIENEVGLHTIIKNAYLSNIQHQLESCGCYLLYLTPSFDLPENRVLRNSIFYQVGFLESRRQQIVVPYMEPDKRIDLSKTPLQAADIIDSTDDVLVMLGPGDDRFRSVIMQNRFYQDEELNVLTCNRIEYRRMIINIDVYRKDFEEAFDTYCACIQDRSITEQDFFDALQYYMTCGVRLLAFGTDDKLTTHTSPYANEQHCLNTLEFPTNFACAHVFKPGQGENEAVMGVYTLELIVPIHKLLGVNFKPFLRVKKPLDPRVIKTLFASNFTQEHDACINADALYFSLCLADAEQFPFDEGLNIGRIADHLFPQ